MFRPEMIVVFQDTSAREASSTQMVDYMHVTCETGRHM